jgi:hypothetical protein
MITYQHILHLLTHRCHEGRYVNGHPEIVQWLDSNPDKTYYIQQMEDEVGVIGYHNVRIWSSYEAYEESKKTKIQRDREEELEVIELRPLKGYDTVHPLVQQLYDACASRNLDLVYELKKRCRTLGLKFDKNKTNIREMI